MGVVGDVGFVGVVGFAPEVGVVGVVDCEVGNVFCALAGLFDALASGAGVPDAGACAAPDAGVSVCVVPGLSAGPDGRGVLTVLALWLGVGAAGATFPTSLIRSVTDGRGVDTADAEVSAFVDPVFGTSVLGVVYASLVTVDPGVLFSLGSAVSVPGFEAGLSLSASESTLPPIFPPASATLTFFGVLHAVHLPSS